MKTKILLASLVAASAAFALDTWYGTEAVYRITTGLDDGDSTSGYWYSYTDSGEGGSSTITWPVDLGNDYSDDALDPVIDYCGGVCFTAALGSDYAYPYVGVAFNVTGSDQTGGDATDWGGLDVCYVAEVKVLVELAPEDEASVTEYNNPYAKLSKAAAVTLASLDWDSFSQENGWGNEVENSDVYGDLAAVKFKIFGATVGTEYFVNITAVGAYGSISSCPSGSLTSLSEDEDSSSSESEGVVMWDGTAYDYRVTTGLDDGDSTSGYWYSYTDSGEGGSSTITWPVDLGNDYSDDALDPVIDYCGALCFTVTLNKGYDYPYAGVAFNVTGSDQTGGDASDWGGLDVQYSGEGRMYIELAPEDEATLTEYNNYQVILAASSSAKVVSKAWSSFSQESGWGQTADIEDVYGDLAAVKFKFTNLTVGTEYTYYIYKVGTYGSLTSLSEDEDSEESSSSSESEDGSSAEESSSSSAAGETTGKEVTLETWFGSDGVYRITTGLDDGDSTSGYWYSYTDSENSGNSTITWPTDLGNAYSDDALDPVIDYCGGVCFTAALGSSYDYPYVGVAFNVTGSDQTGGDATDWGGLDVCYVAEAGLKLELAPENEESVTEYDNPYAELFEAAAVTLSSLSWSEFSQEGWGNEVENSDVYGDLAAVKFKLDGATVGTEYFVNIVGIGEYGAIESCPSALTTLDSSSEESSSSAEESSSSTEESSSSTEESGSSPVLAAKTYSASKVMGGSLGFKVYTNSAAKVQVYDLRGSLVKAQNVSAGETQIGGLKAGVYLVKLSDGTKGMVRIQQ